MYSSYNPKYPTPLIIPPNLSIKANSSPPQRYDFGINCNAESIIGYPISGICFSVNNNSNTEARDIVVDIPIPPGCEVLTAIPSKGSIHIDNNLKWFVGIIYPYTTERVELTIRSGSVWKASVKTSNRNVRMANPTISISITN